MSKKSNQTLSDKLAELANPTPTFIDPEDEYNEGRYNEVDLKCKWHWVLIISSYRN